MKKAIIIIISLIVLAVVAVYAINYVQLQLPMNDVVNTDHRNKGVQVSLRYSNYVDFSSLIYNLNDVSSSNSPADVFRVLLQYAEKIKSKKFKTVELQFRGRPKFLVGGDYFQQLGEEYSNQNPVYTMRTFPENLRNPDGTRAYSEWTGGWLGVINQQMQDFNDFHKKWYANDF